MVQKQTAEEKQKATIPEATPEATPEAMTTSEPTKVSLHIYMPTEGYEQIKKWARYAAIEGLIEGHARGNFTDYCNFCFNLGEQHLRQYMLNKRGYK